MQKTKGFTEFISPISMIFNSISTFIAVIVLFRPSLIEFFWCFIVVDNVSLIITNLLFLPIFSRFFRKAELFYNGVDLDLFSRLSQDERVDFLENMMKFPRQFALGAYFISYLKAIPVYLVIVFHWKHEISNAMQFLIAFGLSSLCFTYFYGCVLFDAHAKISTRFCAHLSDLCVHNNVYAHAVQYCQASRVASRAQKSR
jgi:hypothetical protein